MSILTKEERVLWRLDAERGDGYGARARIWVSEEMKRALDTIDALETELLHADALLENERRNVAFPPKPGTKSEYWFHQRNEQIELKRLFAERMLAGYRILNEIQAFAEQQLPTRVIGGHRAALQKIIEMAGGEG